MTFSKTSLFLTFVTVLSVVSVQIASVQGLAAPVTTPSGLKYVDLVEGDGKQPARNDFVSVHYEGKIKKSGKVFGATRGKADFRNDVYAGTPFSFKLGAKKVIPGWDEGVASMKEGGKRRLIIPADLAYGEAGSPDGVIPKSAELEFDVELVSVDGNMAATGGLGTSLQIALGAIAINGLTLYATGHELREYIIGAV